MGFWLFPGNPTVEGFPLDWPVSKDTGSSIFARYDAKRYVTLGMGAEIVYCCAWMRVDVQIMYVGLCVDARNRRS